PTARRGARRRAAGVDPRRAARAVRATPGGGRAAGRSGAGRGRGQGRTGGLRGDHVPARRLQFSTMPNAFVKSRVEAARSKTKACVATSAPLAEGSRPEPGATNGIVVPSAGQVATA